ncbi:MAG: signal recognition particle protein [Clostridia bacterium]|jgi:signal recognition particle subunit SRP54|nr:signal recognition particle protein [Clostridia bacterium]
MAFEGLSSRLQEITRKLKGKARITESDLKEVLREVKFALLEADVNFKIVKDFIKVIEEKAVGQDVLKSLTPGQQVVKIVKDELVELLGGEDSKINFVPNPPTIIMLVGLQGSGKTTTAGKLANLIRKQGKNPLLVACDVYRPAAIKQLQVVGKQLNVPVYANEQTKDVVAIAKQAMNVAISKLNDVIILDTAGRLHIDEELMQELKNVKQGVKPHEILLVVDSMTGQDAVNVAESFNSNLGIDGVILTKLDGDTRGGAALSVKKVTGKPIKFAATGEKLSDIEEFHPERMASRILGMGDILSVIEKAEEAFDEEEALKMEQKIKKQKFDLEDYLAQMKQMKKMGSFSSILKMIPGMGNLKNIKIDDKEFDKIEAIIYSMTLQERRNPKILNGSRRLRIAKGSGTTVQDINKFMNSFEMTQQMMKKITNNKGAMKKMMRGIDEGNLDIGDITKNLK